MHAYQIVAGFSEIKSHLRTKAKLSKPLRELLLWFSLDGDVLFGHDFHDHKKCIALAAYNKNERRWLIVFEGGVYGRQVIKYAISGSETNNVVKALFDLYKLHGHFVF